MAGSVGIRVSLVKSIYGLWYSICLNCSFKMLALAVIRHIKYVTMLIYHYRASASRYLDFNSKPLVVSVSEIYASCLLGQPLKKKRPLYVMLLLPVIYLDMTMCVGCYPTVVRSSMLIIWVRKVSPFGDGSMIILPV